MPIRLATIDDAQGIAVVVHAMNELRSVAGQSVEATTEIVSSNLRRGLSSGCSAIYVGEENPGDILGYGAVHWTPFLFFPGGEAYITELFVRPAASGGGVGSAILETIVAEAKRRGCARVSLLNGRDGESYRRSFYKTRGWTERDRMANFVLPIACEPNDAMSAIPPRSLSPS